MALAGKKRTRRATPKKSVKKTKRPSKKSTIKKKQPVKRTKAVKKAAAKKSTSSKITQKGSVVGGRMVDAAVPNSQAFTLVEEGGVVYDKHLTYTDCKNNNNKYYIMQILRKGSLFYHLIKYGRIGDPGKVLLKQMGLPQAIKFFNFKVYRKTKYGYTEVDVSLEEQEEEDLSTSSSVKSNSKLPKQTQNLINFIFDMKKIEMSVMEIGFDPKKLPLGKLSAT